MDRKDYKMKEIFQEYGGVLITVAAILSIILVMTAVIGTDDTSVIGTAFKNLITNFMDQASSYVSL